MDDIKNNLLQKILFEAQAYNTYEDIEKLVDGGANLSMIPIQPLYTSLISSSPGQLAIILPKLSHEQRQAFIDLDLWKKDIVDPGAFEYWIEAYSRVQDDNLSHEFSTSEDFYLYLKSRINIHTFDAEDPMYPDHDFYFLTDDNLLLIEYGEDYQFPAELKILLRSMYDSLGVEGAYTTLFKLINDSFSKLQEDSYQSKKERLREFGFVDHYEAMEKLHPFITYSQIKKFINKKGRETGNIDIKSQNQSLHSSALVSFNSDMEHILKELSRVESEKRKIFLHFTFIRLINSTMTLKDALKAGRIELTRLGAHTRSYLDLGLFYIKDFLGEDEIIFSRFDFFDLYKVGLSLVSIEKNRLKKSLRGKSFEESEQEYFVGAWWGSFLENSFLEIPKVKNFGVGLHAQYIKDLASYEFWKKNVILFSRTSPFIEEFSKTFISLRIDGKLQDDFYLNYDIADIDFESILISSFIRFSLYPDDISKRKKLGLTVSEFKTFIETFFVKTSGEYNLKGLDDLELNLLIKNFVNEYGFSEVEGFSDYLYGVLYENTSGYEYESLSFDDFKHVGGPILLKV